MAKGDLKKSRFQNWFLFDFGQTIFVEPNEVDEKSLQHALQVLEAGGVVGLAPEGARSKTSSLIKGRTDVAFLAIKFSLLMEIQVGRRQSGCGTSCFRRVH
jgi:1-acyl-sn-glycerol-3-phosphate acyltransferase